MVAPRTAREAVEQLDGKIGANNPGPAPRRLSAARVCAAALAAFGLGAVAVRPLLSKLAERAEPRTFPMEREDLAGMGGVNGAYQQLADNWAEAIAPVVTVNMGGRIGRCDRRTFLQYILAPQLAEIAATNSAVQAAAEKRCGAALVANLASATWVERR